MHGAQVSTTRENAQAIVSLSSLPAVTLQDTFSHVQHSREGGAFVRCICGYYVIRSGDKTLTCIVCPSKSVFDVLFNVQRILGTCEYECAHGNFVDPSDNLCRELKSRQGIAPPPNAEFVNVLKGKICRTSARPAASKGLR